MKTTTLTKAFQRGLDLGRRGIFRGNLRLLPSEEGVIEVIQNLIDFAKDDPLTDEQLHQDVGIVVGYVLAHPHEF